MRPTESHIAICGHAKHGKSTLAGRLMYELNAISDSDLYKLGKEAEDRGKDFNAFSLLFLQRRSITFNKEHAPDDPSRTVFPERGSARLKNGELLSLIDTPGWPRFMSNIVYGIYLSDLAAVVVDATDGVRDGTEQVVRILSSLAVPIIAVFVTKMDEVGYAQLRFNSVKEQIEQQIFPVSRQYLHFDPPIIPISALSGGGFGDPIDELAWYSGVHALEAIQHAQSKNNPSLATGVRFVIEGSKEVYSPPGIGTVLVGALETSQLATGQELLVEPISTIEGRPITIRTRSIQRARSVAQSKAESVDSIAARSIIAIATSDLSVSQAERYFRHGGVLGSPAVPPLVADEIEAEVMFYNINSVYSGKDYVIHTNASSGRARILEIGNKDKLEYDLSEGRYEVDAGEFRRVRLRFERPLCIESSKEYKRLTLFLLREHNNIVAYGRCLRVIS